MTGSGYVYIIRSGDYAKIGYSRDPVKRLRQLDLPVSELARVFDGGKDIEASLQCHLWHQHVRGEWFNWSAELAYIVANGMPIFAETCSHADCGRTRHRRNPMGRGGFQARSAA
jgi:hypothetical protein